jgi:F-type H+-transporting ATPase subunit delta
MAAKSTIAKRYARAFVDTFSNVADASRQVDGLSALVRLTLQDKNLAAFLESPSFDRDEKWGVLEEILTKTSASKELTQFLRVLLDGGRILLLEEVFTEFKKVLMAKTGQAEALVESAYALTDSELNLVQTNLEKTLGKKLQIKLEVKPELVAGLKIHVDGKTLDGTFASHIEKLKKQLLQAEA